MNNRVYIAAKICLKAKGSLQTLLPKVLSILKSKKQAKGLKISENQLLT